MCDVCYSSEEDPKVMEEIREEYREKMFDAGKNQYYWVCTECGDFLEWIEKEKSNA